MNLKGRDFLTLLDYTPEEIAYLVDLAAELKAKKKAGVLHDVLRGKNVALIFEKTSTRTRCAFEVAAHDLGMGATYLDPSGSQIGKKESIADTAQVLCGMFDGIEYRGYGQEIVNELAKYSTVPVWNGLTNEFHPTQILARLHGRCPLQHGQLPDDWLRQDGPALYCLCPQGVLACPGAGGKVQGHCRRNRRYHHPER